MSDSSQPLTSGGGKHEAFARELAKFQTVYQAAKIAGYNADGTSFKSNARRLAQNSDIKARVAYLQRVSGIETAVDSAYIQRRLVEIANVVIDDEDVRVSDQIAALNLLAKIIGALAPEKHDVIFGDLGKRLDEAIKRTRKDDAKT